MIDPQRTAKEIADQLLKDGLISGKSINIDTVRVELLKIPGGPLPGSRDFEYLEERTLRYLIGSF